jgi:hypothetical protein
MMPCFYRNARISRNPGSGDRETRPGPPAQVGDIVRWNVKAFAIMA